VPFRGAPLWRWQRQSPRSIVPGREQH
jgi:hypothetical protein